MGFGIFGKQPARLSDGRFSRYARQDIAQRTLLGTREQGRISGQQGQAQPSGFFLQSCKIAAVCPIPRHRHARP